MANGCEGCTGLRIRTAFGDGCEELFLISDTPDLLSIIKQDECTFRFSVTPEGANAFTVNTLDSSSILFGGNGSIANPLTSVVRLSGDVGNTLQILPDGLFSTGGITTITADNGLSMSSPTNVQLGGTLLYPTTIFGAGFDFTISGTGGFIVTGPSGGYHFFDQGSRDSYSYSFVTVNKGPTEVHTTEVEYGAVPPVNRQLRSTYYTLLLYSSDGAIPQIISDEKNYAHHHGVEFLTDPSPTAFNFGGGSNNDVPFIAEQANIQIYGTKQFIGTGWFVNHYSRLMFDSLTGSTLQHFADYMAGGYYMFGFGGAGNTVTNRYGFYIKDMSLSPYTVTNKYSIYSEGASDVMVHMGEVRIGSTGDLGAYMLQVTGNSYLTGIDNQIGGWLDGGLGQRVSHIGANFTLNRFATANDFGFNLDFTGVTLGKLRYNATTGAIEVGATHASHPLDLWAGNSLRAQLTRFGNFLIGTTNDFGERLVVAGNARITSIAAPATLTYMVTVDDQGVLSRQVIPGAGAGVPGGVNTNVQFNNVGVFGGSNNFTWDNTNNLLTVTNPSIGPFNENLKIGTGTTSQINFGSEVNAGNYYPRIYFDYSANVSAGFLNRFNGVRQMFIGFANEGSYGGTAATDSGRFIGFYDFLVPAYRLGMNALGDLYIGPSNTTFGVRMSQSGKTLIGTMTDTGHMLQVGGNAYISGNTLLGNPTDTGQRLQVTGTAIITSTTQVNSTGPGGGFVFDTDGPFPRMFSSVTIEYQSNSAFTQHYFVNQTGVAMTGGTLMRLQSNTGQVLGNTTNILYLEGDFGTVGEVASFKSGGLIRLNGGSAGVTIIGTSADTGEKLQVYGTCKITGTTTLSSLSGAGTRMVVADPSGVLSTQPIPSGGGSPAGANQEIQFNNSGVFGASPLFTWDGSDVHIFQNTGEGYGLRIHTGFTNMFFNASGTNGFIGNAATGPHIQIASTNNTVFYQVGNFVNSLNISPGANQPTIALNITPDGFPAAQLINANNKFIVAGTTNNVLINTTVDEGQPLQVAGNATTNSLVKFNSIEIQPYAVNNAWFGDNVFYDGQFKRRQTGYAELFYFLLGEGQFRLDDTGPAGSILSGIGTVGKIPIKFRFDGRVGLGGDVASSPGDFTGATLQVTPTLLILRGSLSDTDLEIRDSGGIASLGRLQMRTASGTNTTSVIEIMPRGAGLFGSLKSRFSAFNTDFITDGINYELVSLAAAGAYFTLSTLKNGTGVARPLYIDATTNDLPTTANITFNIDGTTSLNSLSGTGTRMVVADASGVLSTQAIPTSSTPAGSNRQIQFNNSGAFGASSDFSFTSSGNLLVGTTTDIATNLTGYANKVQANGAVYTNQIFLKNIADNPGYYPFWIQSALSDSYGDFKFVIDELGQIKTRGYILSYNGGWALGYGGGQASDFKTHPAGRIGFYPNSVDDLVDTWISRANAGTLQINNYFTTPSGGWITPEGAIACGFFHTGDGYSGLRINRIGSSTSFGVSIFDRNNIGAFYRYNDGSGNAELGSGSVYGIDFFAANQRYMRLSSAGNLLIGAPGSIGTDYGYALQVFAPGYISEVLTGSVNSRPIQQSLSFQSYIIGDNAGRNLYSFNANSYGNSPAGGQVSNMFSVFQYDAVPGYAMHTEAGGTWNLMNLNPGINSAAFGGGHFHRGIYYNPTIYNLHPNITHNAFESTSGDWVIGNSQYLHFKNSVGGENVVIYNKGTTDGFGELNIRPSSGSPALASLALIPEGSPSIGVGSDFSLYNTDYLVDSVNYNKFGLQANNQVNIIYSYKGGTGSLRAISIDATGSGSIGTSNLVCQTNGNTTFGTTIDSGDKVRVSGSTRTDILKISDNGSIIMEDGSANTSMQIVAAAGGDNSGTVFLRTASGTDTTTSFVVVPRGIGAYGTGYSRTRIMCSNTDVISDYVNYESFGLVASGTFYSIFNFREGTGQLRPITIDATGAAFPATSNIIFNIDRTVTVNSLAGTGTRTVVADDTGLLSAQVTALLLAAGFFVLNDVLPEYADDTAAATGGVPLKGLYRTGSFIKQRVT